ncbi:hypothetical protein CNY89_21245, partial [Amaricoccus sp. HAR-UPW-R2A-40]
RLAGGAQQDLARSLGGLAADLRHRAARHPGAPGALRQDPHVRRRSRRGRALPRIRRLPPRRPGRRRARGRDQPRHDHLLRPALPGPLPPSRPRRRPGPRHPLGLHRADRQGPLGSPCCAPAIETGSYVLAPAQSGEHLVAPAAGISLGMTICYDLRFPGLYRRLAQGGAQ